MIWRDHPWTSFVLLDSSPKPHICNNMKNVVSSNYKFLRTHHARGACYHFGTKSHPYRRCSAPLKEFIVNKIYKVNEIQKNINEIQKDEI